MSPDDLKAWQETMKISGLEAARRLGVASATYRDWRQGVSRTTGKPARIPDAVALACSALVAGLKPFSAKRAG